MASAQLGTVLRHLQGVITAKVSDDASDAELLERFIASHKEMAFQALLARHGRMVLQVCHRTGGNEHDAEDVFQATFLLLARKARSIRKRESVASWLHGVARRLALAAKGKQERRRACERRAINMRTNSKQPREAWRDLQTTLDAALREVPETYRAPLLLCYLEGKTQEEAARQLGCPLGTIRSRIARGRSRLRKMLERRGLCLSATALSSALLVSSVSSAAIPSTMIHATARAALAYAKGTAASALVSVQAASLLEKGLQAVAIAKVKLASGIILLIGALSLGAGALAPLMLASPPPTTGELQALAIPSAQPTTADATPQKMERPQERASQAESGEKTRQKTIVRGRVLDSHGQPLTGARLLLLATSDPETPSATSKELGLSASDGRFSIEIKQDFKEAFLLASSAGLGVDWIELSDLKPGAEATLRLPEDVSITGRVLNTEGRPIEGVSVSISELMVPAHENLNEYLAGCMKLLPENLSTPQKRLYWRFGGVTGRVRTGKDGRFTVRGAGAERIAQVTFEGAGIARSSPFVITRPGLDPKPYNDALSKIKNRDLLGQGFHGINGPSFTFVAEGGKVIEGLVKDAATGTPIPECMLAAHIGIGDRAVVSSAANGTYRIEGIPKSAQGYSIFVSPPKGSPYLTRIASVPDTAGYEPITFNLELVKGVVVTGRVLDKQTGKGVSSEVRFAPLPDNKLFASKPGFDNYLKERTSATTEEDGRFRLSTIPGKALVMIQAQGKKTFQGEFLNPYLQASPDPDYSKLFQYDADEDIWTIASAAGLEVIKGENAVKVVDIKPDGETNVELYVDPGRTVELAIQDGAGKPLSGAWVAGLTDSWPITYRLQQSSATVYALNPDKPRILAIYHPEAKLGGTVTMRGDEKVRVVAKLSPLGKITGRLVDAEGNPLTGAKISIDGRTLIFRELHRFAQPTGSKAATDSEGKFCLDGVVPGVNFSLQIQDGERVFGGKPRIGVRRLAAGETLNLGDRIVEPLP